MSDYVIVGAGSAGCVMASRLSEDPDITVTLIEAGGSDRHPLVHVPAGFTRMTRGFASWGWSTVPQIHLNGRVLRYTQARVLGGGSSINAQIYTRGHAADYNGWARHGCRGWSHREVLPCFKRAEDNQRFLDDYHLSHARRCPDRRWRATPPSSTMPARAPRPTTIRSAPAGWGGRAWPWSAPT